MPKRVFRFIDLHLSVWVKIISISIVVAILGYIFFQIPIWSIPLILCTVLLIIIAFNSSQIVIEHGLKKPIISIKNVNSMIRLQTPIEANVWWNYSYKPGMVDYFFWTTPSKASASDINVMLEIIDKDNQKVTFVEKIIFGNRFPNEANYSLDMIDENSVVFKTQRIDKMIDFIDDYLVD